MQRIGLIAGILVLGALLLSPAVAAFDLDPLPGDIRFHWGNAVITLPVIYSLCASAGLTLLYKIMTR